jgi:fructokinase
MSIGIDLGGTKIEAVALNGAGQECARQRIATPRGDYSGIIRAIVELVGAIEATIGQKATVGVGIPGAISPMTQLVKNANTTELIGHPLDRDLGAALSRDVRLDNDANCFALSEAVDGAGKGLGTVFGVIIGTGCGGGLVVDGRILKGRNLIAGEWGHNPLPWPSARELATAGYCYCGKRGCVETWISGTGFACEFAGATGRTVSAPEIIAAANAGDPLAEAAYHRYADRLARALATVINTLDPDVIVLGGGMSQVERLYGDVPRLLPAYVFSDQVDTPIRPPRHGDSSVVRGAAWLWPAPH